MVVAAVVVAAAGLRFMGLAGLEVPASLMEIMGSDMVPVVAVLAALALASIMAETALEDMYSFSGRRDWSL